MVYSKKGGNLKSLEEIYEELTKPFPASKIRWRIGSRTKDKSRGKLLAYIDARDVMERLDSVVGWAKWEDTYEDTSVGKQTGVRCLLSITLPESPDAKKTSWSETITKCDAAPATQVEDLKGAYSDAFKRAAVKFGIGRDLYDLDGPWVKLKDGKYFDQKDIPRLPDKYYKVEGDPKTKAKKANPPRKSRTKKGDPKKK